MSDRELLELAAKAAEIGPLDFDYPTRESNGMYFGPRLPTPSGVIMAMTYRYWNPLEDDGDAFRLALKLRIQIEYVDEMDSVMCSLPGSMGATSVAAIGDVELRYAIVQAAAQLGATI